MNINTLNIDNVFDKTDGLVTVRKGSYIKTTNPSTTVHSKNFVFDLDETIGSFSELDILWRGLRTNGWIEDTLDDFHRILDLYPEFLRYGILTILDFLYFKKQRGECQNVYIYTNNQCEGDWTWRIIMYLEKAGRMRGLVDQIIRAFTIDGKIVEEKRTMHTKSFSDFVRCTLLPKHADLCFVDNTYFSKMKHARVFYIQPKPYYHSLSWSDILGRLVGSTIGQEMISRSQLKEDQWKQSLLDWSMLHGASSSHRHKSAAEREMDILVSKKLMYYLKDFFYLSMRKPKTRKIMGKFWRDRTKKHR